MGQSPEKEHPGGGGTDGQVPGDAREGLSRDVGGSSFDLHYRLPAPR
jgi:hypothetical protein